VTGFLAAAQFLTRVPIRLRSAPDLTAGVPWFPVVGALIGAASGITAAALGEVVPTSVAAASAIVVGLLITGAFHEDGLADTADAMGGWTPEQRRAILKDSRHGSYGVAAMCSTIVIRIVCVAALGPASAFAGLVAAHTLARGAVVGVMATTTPSEQPGIGADQARSLSGRAALTGIAAALAIGALATGWWVGPLALAAGLGAAAAARLAQRAFEGVSGDHLGAAEQVAECLVLIVVTGLARHHAPWWA
jgi:adenosylcobinamide-GDP ribazoletransferase